MPRRIHEWKDRRDGAPGERCGCYLRSGPGLDRLVESLEAQSLAPGDLELIAVDDGSGDGTLERLTALAATRPWDAV